MLKLTKTFPITIDIDGEPVRAIITRLTDEQYAEYSLAWNRIQRWLERPVDRREGEDGLTDEQVRAKREAEMSIEALTAHREVEDFHNRESAQFTIDAITKYVRFEPGQVYDDDVPVVSGEEIYRAFATRDAILSRLVLQVHLQNTLSAEQKKRLRLRSDSARSLNGPETTTDGERPAPTADAAALPATVASADVMVANVMT